MTRNDTPAANAPAHDVYDFSKETIRRLQAWCAEAVPGMGEIEKITRIKGGQSNPTFEVNTSTAKFVIRMRPIGSPMWAHHVEREYRVMTALAQTPVPVPKTCALCEDSSVLGGNFYVMDYVEGRVIDDYLLRELPMEHRRPAYENFIEVLAEIHRVDIDRVGLRGYGRDSGYLERQIEVMGRPFRVNCPKGYEDMVWVGDQLRKILPPVSALSLIHGDIRIGNTILSHTEPRPLAVVDWELSTLGDPLADAAQIFIGYYLPDNPVGRIDPVTARLMGIPSEEEMIAAYCKAAGLDEFPHLKFYLALVLYRAAAIYYGVGQRARAEGSTDPVAYEFEAASIPSAARAREILETSD